MEFCRSSSNCDGALICCNRRCRTTASLLCFLGSSSSTVPPNQSGSSLGTPYIIMGVVTAVSSIIACYVAWRCTKKARQSQRSNSSTFSSGRQPRIIERSHPNGTISLYVSRTINSNGPGRILERFEPTTPVPTISDAMLTTTEQDTTPDFTVQDVAITAFVQDSVLLPDNTSTHTMDQALPSYSAALAIPHKVNSNSIPTSSPPRYSRDSTALDDDEPPSYEEVAYTNNR